MKRFAAGLFGLVLACGAAHAGAREMFSEFEKDFGSTPRGPILVHYFTVKNNTNQAVTLGTPRVSCGCVSAAVLTNQLAPGQTTAVLAHMDTRRIPQSNVLKSVTVYVPFLAPQFEEVSVRVHAVARDDLMMTPDTLTFGTVKKGQGGKATTRVTLYNDPNWQIREATCTGGYIKAEAKPVARQGAESTYEITAALDPACPVGDWTAEVWLKTSNPGVERLRIPVRVQVVAPLALEPGSVKLSGLKQGETAEHRVMIRGSEAFKVTDVTGGGDEVKVTPQSQDSKLMHVLTIAVNPKQAGELSRNLEIVTDHKEQPKVLLPFRADVLGR